MKKKIFILLIFLILIAFALSLEDKADDNTAWCGTFNLIWNDLKNDLAKQNIVFTPQPEIQ